MKVFTFVLMMALSVAAVQAQGWEFGSNFNYASATGSMAKNIDDAFGITFDVAKKLKSPFSLGVELDFGAYGYQTSRQQYTFDDGSVTETDVNVSNNITNLFITSKYFWRNGKRLNPYVSGKVGWSWFRTTLAIEDPDDQFACHPIESDILAKDDTYIFSGGAGVRLDFQALFKKMEAGRFYFDLSVHSTQGGVVRYMNTAMDPSQPAPDKDVNAKFINTQTQVIHEHHVGYIYSSTINMIEYRFGMIFRTTGFQQ
ncbi:MAG: outer membrane beta-barrel protein [Bacteroidota bacterium]